MSYSSEVLADSPLLYWKMDESSGTTLADASGNGRTGTTTATGLTYSATALPPFGSTSAITGDGTAGGAAMTSALNFDAYTVLTVEFWAKFASFNNSDKMAAEMTTTGSNGNGGISIDPCDAGAAWAVRIKCGSGTNQKTWTRPSTGTAHHFAFVLKKATQAGAITGYLDGALWTPASTTETGTTSTNWLSEKWYILSRATTSLFLAATMDEFAIYSGDLGATRIAAHYTAGTTAAPANTVAPAVTGTAVVGQTLTCSTGTWTGTPTPTYTYQWQRGGVDIGGQTASTHALVDADDATTVGCVVTATNTAGAVSANSNGVAITEPVPTISVAPAITGTTAVGDVLTCSTGTWLNQGGTVHTYAYQWKRDTVNIAGQTAATHTIVSADQGTTLTCAVTATNTGGASSPSTSNGVAIAAAATEGTVNPGLLGYLYTHRGGR